MTTLNKDDVILEDIGFTSALEIDRKVSDNVDYFFQLRDHSTRHAFQTFNNHHQTLSALFSANIFISIFTIPYIIVMGTNLAFSSSAFELSSCIIILVLLLTINITVWKVYLHIQQVLKGQEVHLSASLRDFLHSLLIHHHNKHRGQPPLQLIQENQENPSCFMEFLMAYPSRILRSSSQPSERTANCYSRFEHVSPLDVSNEVPDYFPYWHLSLLQSRDLEQVWALGVNFTGSHQNPLM
eukprot:gene879-960_t